MDLAFERWLRRALDDQVAVGCAVRFARNRHLAEDILQEAYTRAWQHRHEIQSEEHLRHWLRVVVINLVRDRHRRMKHKLEPLQDADVIPDEARPALLDAEARDYVRHYLDQLAADDRRLIELRYFEERTLEEIQTRHPEWGSVTTIWKHVRAVCDRLRTLMSQGEPVAP